jgi:uncharacterized protein (TIGR04255 family)
VPFPETPRVVYERNPLAQVICQLRFPTILRIASELPAEFQQEIRDTYPVFQQEEALPGLPPEVSQVLENLPVRIGGPEGAYLFATADGQRTVALTRDFIAVTERDYSRWENLRAEIDRIKAAFERI